MEKEPLDNNFITPNKNRKLSNLRNWSAIIILWAGILVTVLGGLFINLKVIFGGFLLFAATITTYKDLKTGAEFTLGIIFLGVINFLSFFPVEYYFGIGVGFVSISIKPLPIITAIIHYKTNKEYFPYFFNVKISAEEQQKETETRIKVYKNRFKNRTPEELEKIACNDLLLPEAIQAAKELIQEQQADI